MTAAIRLWGETEPREVVSQSLAERWPVEGGPVRYVVAVVGRPGAPFGEKNVLAVTRENTA